MRNFIKTKHCACGIHCRVCRDLDGGRAWRESLAKVFDLPGGVVDFECPNGKPWGFIGAKPKMTIGQLAKKRRNCIPCGRKRSK